MNNLELQLEYLIDWYGLSNKKLMKEFRLRAIDEQMDLSLLLPRFFILLLTREKDNCHEDGKASTQRVLEMCQDHLEGKKHTYQKWHATQIQADLVAPVACRIAKFYLANIDLEESITNEARKWNLYLAMSSLVGAAQIAARGSVFFVEPLYIDYDEKLDQQKQDLLNIFEIHYKIKEVTIESVIKKVISLEGLIKQEPPKPKLIEDLSNENKKKFPGIEEICKQNKIKIKR